jgi:hypothetical protein
MGKFMVIGLNSHCASAPMFIPGDDPRRNHTIVTVIANRGKSKAGVDLRAEVTLNIWGKYAGVAACHLDKGRQINFIGELLSHTKDTGAVGADGKKVMHRRNEVRVDRFFFGGDTLKELTSRVGKNLAAIQAAGQPITPDALLKSTKSATVDYNPALAAQTGMYGNARVWIKGQGFLKPGAVAPQQVVAAPAGKVEGKTVEQLQKEMDDLKAAIAQAAAGNAAAPVDAFAGAQG